MYSVVVDFSKMHFFHSQSRLMYVCKCACVYSFNKILKTKLQFLSSTIAFHNSLLHCEYFCLCKNKANNNFSYAYYLNTFRSFFHCSLLLLPIAPTKGDQWIWIYVYPRTLPLSTLIWSEFLLFIQMLNDHLKVAKMFV